MEYKPVYELMLGVLLVAMVPIIIKIYPIALFDLSFFRVLFAAVAILFYIKLRKKQKLLVQKQNVLLVFAFGLFHAITIVAYFYSVMKTNVSVATILLYCSIFYTSLISYFLFKEKFNFKLLVGGVMAMAGLILLFVNDINANMSITGYIFGAVAGLAMSLVLVTGKKLTNNTNVFVMLFYQNLIAAILLLPFVIIKKQNITYSLIFLTLFIGIVCTAIAYILIYRALTKISTTKTNIYFSFQIILPIIFGIFFLKEPVYITKIIGIGFFYFSTMLVR
ncbi:DMT family transporter [Candidatus Woesearchaeota archaeon]|nr:MAG: DMT family transporter [Candidatus Woesearchaeota archaeon]